MSYEIQARVGITVGRFQVAHLTEAHKALIETMLNENHYTVVLIGVRPFDKQDKRNPLTYEMRRNMILEEFSKIPVGKRLIIMPFEDKDFFPLWVKELDVAVSSIVKMLESKVYEHFVPYLYGGRDSFLDGYIKYSNFYNTINLQERESFQLLAEKQISGTKQREEIAKSIPTENGEKFREGIIYQIMNQK